MMCTLRTILMIWRCFRSPIMQFQSLRATLSSTIIIQPLVRICLGLPWSHSCLEDFLSQLHIQFFPWLVLLLGQQTQGKYHFMLEMNTYKLFLQQTLIEYVYWNSVKAYGSPAQLTIFYAGAVNVYDDISPEKVFSFCLSLLHINVCSS